MVDKIPAFITDSEGLNQPRFPGSEPRFKPRIETQVGNRGTNQSSTQVQTQVELDFNPGWNLWVPSPSSINFMCKVVVRVSKPRFQIPGPTQILVEDGNRLKPMLNLGSNPPLGTRPESSAGAVKGS